MKKMTRIFIAIGLLLSLPALAQYSPGTGGGGGTEEDTLTKYVKNLSGYLGYDVEQNVTSPILALLDYTLNLASTGQQTLDVFFAARLVNPSYQDFSTNANYSEFNKQANSLFVNYGTASQSNVSIVENFDQKNYQKDPVSQMLLNILATVDTSTCSDTDDSCMSKNKVMYTVLQDIMEGNSSDGTLAVPAESTYFNSDHVSKYLSQLNVNTLTSPLIYSVTSNGSSKGLPSNSQQLQAMDFIRYVTAEVLPNDTMSQTDYSNLWQKANQKTEGKTQADINDIKNARKDLMSYLLKSRVYTAQSSVPISNLIESMSKRMPQTVSGTDDSVSMTTSQAFNEFIMATWRMYSPGIATDQQWVGQLNAASAATTQKEIAILLSEINYQMYLGRQIQERILLTNSILALNSLATNRPNSLTLSSSSLSTT